jgi:transcriptional regulator with XRE-family HTH domain
MPDDDPEIGARLRSIRTERNLSLAAVAEETGISASFLSLVETGKNDITFGRLRRLIDFYGVTLADLLPSPEDPIVVRAGDHRHLVFPTEGIDLFVLAPGVDNGELYAALAIYDPASEVEEPMRFEGMVLLHVLDGKLNLHLPGSPAVVLGPGDSACVPGSRDRRVSTGPEEGARFLFVAAPSPFAGSGHREAGGSMPIAPP